MTTNEIILGIDLGTTFSLAAYVDDQGRPKVIRNAEGEKTTPSVVLIESGQIQVGAIALNQAIVKGDNVVQWIKRSMGDLDYRFHDLGPIEISAEILKKLKADAELELGVPVRKAVITCPAYFSANEVENTVKAGRMAGFEVQEIVKEPTAAAVYYGVEHLKDGNKLLVCDLGGGTYDASILTLENGIFKPLATAGDRQSGGHDWTSDLLENVADLLIDSFGENPRSDLATGQTLYDACEQVKRDFARSDQGVITCIFKGKTAQVTISRSDFERMTEWRIQQMLIWTEKALEKCTPPLTWDQIDHILLVGGATRMRRVAEAIKEISGKQPIQTAETDTMVALGAAILAKGIFQPRRGGITKKVIYRRIAERNLGTKVIVRTEREVDIKNSIIIPYGTEIPTEKTRKDYQTSVATQNFFDIPVVEFDDIGPEVIQDTWRFNCPPGLPRKTSVHITFRYDKSGQIDVEAIEQNSYKSLSKKRITYEEPDLDTIRFALPPPRNIVFALDVSSSMADNNKIHRAKQAVIDHALELINASLSQIQIGVIAFSSQAEVICPLTSELQKITQIVSEVSADGSTAMDAGIREARHLLSKSASGVTQEIVLVSDGMPDDQNEALTAGLQVQHEGIRLCLLSIGRQGIDEAFLRRMTPHYLIIKDAEEISQAMGSFLAEAAPKVGITWL
jgi:molecular chaperone DnaK